MDKIITNILNEGTYTLDELQAAIDKARDEGGTTAVILDYCNHSGSPELRFRTTVESENNTLLDAHKHYEVWIEGYACTGDSSGASRLGSTTATSFYEACVKLAGDRKDFDEKTLSVWGCRLYDNREDAQRSFG